MSMDYAQKFVYYIDINKTTATEKAESTQYSKQYTCEVHYNRQEDS